MKLRLLTLAIVLNAFRLFSQNPISDVVNLYTPVTGFSCDSVVLSVGQTAGFSVGDLVLIVQMQGATVSLANDNTFGDIQNIDHVGNYEYNRVENTGSGKIRLRYHLSRSYNVAGKVQLVRVPEYADVAATNLTCKAWDGVTGGILALDVSGTLTLQNNIDVSSKGFLGGQVADANISAYHETQYFYPIDPVLSADKGEGIAILPNTHAYGRGKAANGGGGGNAHNAGGGGGGNAGMGGNGGREYYNTPSQPTPNTFGVGGLRVFELDAKKAIMGGGGGAGHANDEVSVSGGNGGGIIFLRANVVKANNFKLLSNGGDVISPGDQRNDGQGGGGAGGTVFFKANQLVDNLTVELKGGRGGDCLFYVSSQIIGPGGGGGGGKLALNQPFPNLISVVTGGANGIANQNLSNEAKPGQTGKTISNAAFWPDDTTPAFTEQQVALCPGASINLGGQIYTQPGTVKITLPGQNGCDSVVYYTLTLATQPTKTETISFCPGDVVVIGGENYTTSGTVIDTIPGTTGCDTIVTYTLIRLEQPVRSETLEFCPGDVVVIGGENYTTSGTVIDTIPGTTGCDTIVTYTLIRLEQPVRSETIEFCPGDVVVIGGENYTSSGTVIDTIPGTTGCDTIVTYTLIRLEQPVRSETLEFCPGDVVVIGGENYSNSGTVIDTIPGTTGCDTIVTYTLIRLEQPVRSETLEFCPGDVVVIGGENYSNSGTLIDTIPGTSGCDTIVTYTLIRLEQPVRSETLEFCPGDVVVIGGENYTSSGTVIDTIPGTTGCDTIVTYTLIRLPYQLRSETIEFCPGEQIVIGGLTYTHAGVVVDTIPGAVGCDTIVTYTLVSLTPAPSVVTIHCPNNVSVIADAGTAPLVINYDLPTAASDCPCPGLSLNLTAGLPSGAAFPNGITQVCYTAKDSCGHSASCCFSVTIREIQPCDVKVNGCIRYELLSITADPAHNLTYRIRVINNCANKLIYTAIQLPDAVVALAPDHLSIFTADSGREYEVRNPNYSPFYSIRFKSTNDSIFGGQSEIFEYTLPAQSEPTYMDITSRLAPQVFYEAHLNTFYCPIGITPPSGNRNETVVRMSDGMVLYPNPTEGKIWVEMSIASGRALPWRIYNSQGQEVLSGKTAAGDRALGIELPATMANGLFFLEVLTGEGARKTARFELQR